MKKALRWKIDQRFYNSEDYQLNNQIALRVHKYGYDKISEKYTHIKAHEIEHFLRISDQVYNALSGYGIDLGGGVGSVSSVVARSKKVQNIICLEITENCVIKCHPIVINTILGSQSSKVQSVIGDFDNLEIDNNSLDFAIAWDAMHHSNNIVETLLEANRVLKPGGYFVVVDRGHNNSTSDTEIERMLNVQYSKEFLIENFLPEEKVLTRRDNGEHEYLYKQWNDFFKLSNFQIVDSFIVREKHEKNADFKNDAGMREVFVDYELGGFERQKVVYLLQKKHGR